MANVRGDMRVWHIPQVPGPSFKVEVKTLREARSVMNVLANYDRFQLENRIKGDYCNVSGLSIYYPEDGDEFPWVDYADTLGRSVDEIPEAELDTAVWEDDEVIDG
jgi:hypothetical protein